MFCSLWIVARSKFFLIALDVLSSLETPKPKVNSFEELFFDKYPWGNCKKILWEDSPWNKKYYDSKLPFIKKYDGNTKHALVKYS